MDTPSHDLPDLPDHPDDPRQPRRMADLFSPFQVVWLEAVCGHADFALRPHPNVQPGESGFATLIGEGAEPVIYYHPTTVHTMERIRVWALMVHELGHHNKRVVAFQNSCNRFTQSCINALPPVLARRRKIVHTCMNILADILLEDCCSRHVPTDDTYRTALRHNRAVMMLEDAPRAEERLAAYEASGRKTFPWDQEELGKTPPYAQLMNLSLIAPFYDLPPPDWVHPLVAGMYERFNRLFSELRADDGFAAKGHLLLEYVQKMLLPLIRLAMQEISDGDGDAQSLLDQYGELSDKIDKESDEADRKTAPGREPQQSDKKQDERPDADEGEPRDARAEEIRERIARERRSLEELLAREEELRRLEIEQGAGRLGIKKQTYVRFQRTCEDYAEQRRLLTETLSYFVLRDLERKTEFHRRGGFMVVPGRELETRFRMAAGDLNPDTTINERDTRWPRRAQLASLVDVSGSMIAHLDGTLGYYTVLSSAAMHVQNELQMNAHKYDIPPGWPPPLSAEVIVFDDLPEVVLPLTEDITEQALARGYEHILERTLRGGGTNDSQALRFMHGRLQQGDPYTIKILSMLTDGQGNSDRLAPVLDQIQDDPSIFLIVTAVGPEGEAIVRSYVNRFRPASAFRVHASAHPDVPSALANTTNLIRGWVADHFESEPIN